MVSRSIFTISDKIQTEQLLRSMLRPINATIAYCTSNRALAESRANSLISGVRSTGKTARTRQKRQANKMTFDDAKKIIARHPDMTDFVGPTTEQEVRDAEKRLGVKFSRSYLAFLREFGCGNFG